MADLPHKRSPTPPRTTSEDPDTAEARKELRQTAISEKKPDLSSSTSSIMSAKAKNPAAGPVAGSVAASVAAPVAAPETADTLDTTSSHSDRPSSKPATPERDLSAAQSSKKKKEGVSSTKKKRAHDEVDQVNHTDQDTSGDVSPSGSNHVASASRTERSEPEKKRPRDVSSEAKNAAGVAKESTVRSTLYGALHFRVANR